MFYVRFNKYPTGRYIHILSVLIQNRQQVISVRSADCIQMARNRMPEELLRSR